eukprot:GILJ01009248.1.p1 GENE.GILJ01009248.1~~GILJ01009248.1.p1  ORF type:complete len:943 (-),score=102.35 GILJ01009248.1:123-2888(-)
MGEWAAILTVLSVNAGVLAIFLLLWYHVWVKKYPPSIPRRSTFRGNDEEQDSSMIQQTLRLRDLFRLYQRIIWHDRDGVVLDVCGLDAFIYLRFQRYVLRLMIFYAVVSLGFSLPVNLALDDSAAQEDQEEPGYFDTTGNWFERTTLNNKRLDRLTSWFHLLLVFVFTFTCYLAMFHLVMEVKEVLRKRERSYPHQRLLRVLKKQTLHVRGMLQNDFAGAILYSQLNARYGGGVLAVVMVPDLNRLTQLEIKKRDYSLRQTVFSHNVPAIAPLLCGNVRITAQFYRERIALLDNDIQKERDQPVESFHHAFVVFTDQTIMDRCEAEFHPTPVRNITVFFQQVKKAIKHLFTNREGHVFDHFIDDLTAAPELPILVNPCPDPVDIIWSNVGTPSSGYFVRRVLLNLLAILVLIFLSTPTVIFSTLKSIQGLNVLLDFGWTHTIPDPYGNLLFSYLPSLTILGIHQLVLQLIDVSAYQEKRVTHTRTQKTILVRSYFYLMLNVLIVPSIALASVGAVIKVIQSDPSNVTDLLSGIYLANSGSFFVNILIQNAITSSMFYLVRIPELFFAWFSVELAYRRRTALQDAEPWQRVEGDIFQYGYFYAQFIAMFSITLTFSSTIPLVVPAGILFVVVRHMVDTYNLLFVHKKEMESDGGLIQRVLKFMMASTCLYQLAMVGFFYATNLLPQAFLCFFLFFSTVLFSMYSTEWFDVDKVEEDEVPEATPGGTLGSATPASQQAEDEDLKLLAYSSYKHPMMMNFDLDMIHRPRLQHAGSLSSVHGHPRRSSTLDSYVGSSPRTSVLDQGDLGFSSASAAAGAHGNGHYVTPARAQSIEMSTYVPPSASTTGGSSTPIPPLRERAGSGRGLILPGIGSMSPVIAEETVPEAAMEDESDVGSTTPKHMGSLKTPPKQNQDSNGQNDDDLI